MPDDNIGLLQRLMIDGGETAFDLVPHALAKVIEERQWANKQDQQGVPFKSFEAFVEHKLWWGLGSSIDDLLAYCPKHPDVRELIETEVGPLAKHGGDHREQGSNTTLGNRGATYTLKRLKRDHPDLAAKVVRGELSKNAAAIEAGFRKRPSPFQQILKLLPALSPAERADLIKRLQ